MPRSRLLTPLVLLPAALLATASCSAAPPVQEVARVVVPVSDDGPDGRYGQARAVHPGPDGTLLVTVGNLLPEAAAMLAVVDPDTGELRATAALAAGTDPDTAFGWEGSAVVAGTVWPGAGPVGYALQVVDPGSGAVTATLPVALPEGATLSGSSAVLGSDGVLHLAVSRIDGGPVLLAVDPGTGGVLTSAPLDLGDAGEDSGQVVVTDVAAAPDAGTVAVVAQVLDGHAVVVTVDADLAPLRDPVVLAPDWPSSTAGAVAVDAEGTVYAPAYGRPGNGRTVESVFTVAAGEDTATSLTGDEDLPVAADDVAVADGTVWLSGGTARGTSLSAVDAATGEVSDPLFLCDDGTGTVAAGGDGRVAVTAECHGEAVLWLLDPR